jgi:hypothetical protein
MHVAIGSLKPCARNARTHSRREVWRRAGTTISQTGTAVT